MTASSGIAASEVRRYQYDADNEHMEPELFGNVEMILASDHDRVVADLKASCRAAEDLIRLNHETYKASLDAKDAEPSALRAEPQGMGPGAPLVAALGDAIAAIGELPKE